MPGMLAAAAPAIRKAERERGEALIIQAQDYASAESERAGKLSALALKLLNQCHALTPGDSAYLDEWSMALDQLDGAAGHMSPPDSDPLEEAYQTGIKAERERIRRLAVEHGAICHVDFGNAVWPMFADLLKEGGQ